MNIYAVQPTVDGKLIGTGTISTSSDSNIYYDTLAVVKLNLDGSLDTTFNAAGSIPGLYTLQLNGATGFTSAVRPIMQPDGRIIVGVLSGTSQTTYTSTAIRLSSNGVRDMSFGVNGRANVPLPATL